MHPLRLSTVLAATDLSESSGVALRSAARLARAAGGALHVAYVAPESRAIIGDGGARAENLARLSAFVGQIGEVAEHTPHVLMGEPASALTALAGRVGANVIVTGRRRGDSAPPGRPLGGTAYAVITRSPVPCLAIAEPLAVPVQRVLVATDGSDASRGAMLVALSWASALRSRSRGDPVMRAVHVSGNGDGKGDAGTDEVVEREVACVRRHAGDWAAVQVNGTTASADDSGGVPAAIAVLANEYGADLLVIGTRGLGDRDGALGSVAAALLERVAAPVLLVPPPVWREYARDA